MVKKRAKRNIYWTEAQVCLIVKWFIRACTRVPDCYSNSVTCNNGSSKCCFILKNRMCDALECKCLQARRQRCRRQSRQYMMFTFLLSDYSVTSMIHMDEMTEQQLVGGRGKCYNDWLENFRMSNATFLL